VEEEKETTELEVQQKVVVDCYWTTEAEAVERVEAAEEREAAAKAVDVAAAREAVDCSGMTEAEVTERVEVEGVEVEVGWRETRWAPSTAPGRASSSERRSARRLGSRLAPSTAPSWEPARARSMENW
jgi:hypothetical protein